MPVLQMGTHSSEVTASTGGGAGHSEAWSRFVPPEGNSDPGCGRRGKLWGGEASGEILGRCDLT